MTRNILGISSGLALTVLALSAVPASAQVTLAADDAANYSNNGQITTQNNGTGFTGPFTATGGGGYFLGDSKSNGNVQYGGPAGVGINSGSGTAFGIYGGGSGETLQRTLTVPLVVGNTFSFGFDNGFVNNGAFDLVGIGNAGNNTLVAFGFQGGLGNYFFNFNQSSLGYTDGGLNVAFTLTGATTYTLTATRLSDNATASVNGTVPLGTILDTITLNNSQNQGGTTNDFFVNSLSVTAPVAAPEPSPILALTVAALALGMLTVRARRRTHA